jgi:hypothetical protein
MGVGREAEPVWHRRDRGGHGARPRRAGRAAGGGGRGADAGTRGAGRRLPLRPGPQGLPRHGAQPHLQGLVHGRRRRPVRRLLPDRRQHQRRDPPVRRHRRRQLHRPADPRHDLHRHGPRPGRDGLPGHRHGQERPLPDRHRLPDRPGQGHGRHAGALPAAGRLARRLPPLRPPRPDGERQRRGRYGQRRRRHRHGRHLHRPPGAGGDRHPDGHHRRQPRLRPAGVRRAGRLHPVHPGVQRLRGQRLRRPQPAR